MKHLDLFSGIGGFALAVETVWPNSEHIFCEINPYCQAILKKRFGGKIYGDIRTLTTDTEGAGINGVHGNNNGTKSQNGGGAFEFDGSNKCDILTGGFPCQPFSLAGKRRGKEDDRYLWPEMLRVIREFRPTWVIGENVAGIVKMALDQVLSDLENEGYSVQAFIIPACAVNAPHRRDRVWIVGYSKTRGDGRHEREVATKTKSRSADISSNYCIKTNWNKRWIDVAIATCDVRVDDGLPARVDGLELSKSRHRTERLKALGNAIVPDVAVEIMLKIRELEYTGWFE